MAILKIARMGHPVLKKVAEPVDDPTASSVARLVDNMVETMLDAPGQGLAAPQVYVSKRIVVYIPPPPDEDDDGEDSDDGRKIRVLVNPLISRLDDDMTDNWEGCLSVPDLRGVVPRYTRIHIAATRLDGSAIDETVEGHHARVIQHECDHLDGVLYPQRMTDLSTLMFESEMRHLIAEARAAREAAEEPLS